MKIKIRSKNVEKLNVKSIKSRFIKMEMIATNLCGQIKPTNKSGDTKISNQLNIFQ